MNVKVTKRSADGLNSMLFALNVKKNLDLDFLKSKSLPRKNTEFHRYVLFSVFSAKISIKIGIFFGFALFEKNSFPIRREKRGISPEEIF
jgi:hypothetical protein